MRAKARNAVYGLALIAVMLAVLAVTVFKVMTGKEQKVPTQITHLTITQLAEAKMSADHLLKSGVCATPEERWALVDIIDRIDEAVKLKRMTEKPTEQDAPETG